MTKKRCACFLMALILCLTLLPGSAYAGNNPGVTESTGEGQTIRNCCMNETGNMFYTGMQTGEASSGGAREFGLGSVLLSAAQKLAPPTNLRWETECKEYDQEWHGKVSPGYISWTDEINSSSMYKIQIYNASGDTVHSANWEIDPSVNDYQVDDFLMCVEADGTYTFSVQALSDSGSGYDSDVVYSGSWTYTPPQQTLVVPTGIYIDDSTLKWAATANADGYEVECSYSGTLAGEKQIITGCWWRENLPEIDISDTLNSEGPGYYHYRLRSLSNDITLVCNSGYTSYFTVYGSGSGTASKIPVRSDDEVDVLDSSKLELDGLLENISFGTDKIYGPSVTILGKTFYLFELNGKVDLDLGDSKWNIQAKADTEKKTIQVLVGFDEIKDSAIVGDEQSGRGEWQKSWHEVKDLYNSLSGNDVGGWMAGPGYRNLHKQLVKEESTIFLKIKGRIAGYLEWSYETGSIEFSEGGMILTASAEGSIDSRIAAFPAAYVTVGLKVETAGKISVAFDGIENPMSISSDLKISPALNVGVGLGGKKAKTYIEGGLKGILDVGLIAMTGSFLDSSTNFDPLTVTVSGSLYLKAKLFILSTSSEWELLEKQLYPDDNGSSWKKASNGASELFSAVSPDEFSVLPRDYLTGSRVSSSMNLNEVQTLSAGDSFAYSKESLYPYCEPQLIMLSDGSALLIWVDDNGEKGDADRTSLFCSTYNPNTGNWSDCGTIWDNEGYNGSPEVFVDGDTVHVVWQRVNQSFGDSVTVEQMMETVDLYYSCFSGGSFSEPVCITNSEMALGESMYSIAADGEFIAVCWAENSLNDPYMTTGNNTMYLRTCIDGEWQDEEIVAEAGGPVNNSNLHIVDGEAYVIYELGGENPEAGAISSLYIWDGAASISEDATGVFNPAVSNETLYFLNNTALYAYDFSTGLANPTGHTGLTNFEIVSNGEEQAVLTLVSTGFTCEMYASFLDTQGMFWSDWIQMTDFGKYIRGYSAFMDVSGRIITAINLVDVLELNEENDELYGDAKLVVIDGLYYSDLLVNEHLSYDVTDVIAGEDIVFSVEVQNNSENIINSLTVILRDDADNVLSAREIPTEVGAGELADVEIEYTLPLDLSLHTITAQVIPDYAEENLFNNYASTSIGYADITIAELSLTSYPDGATVTGVVKNQGYSPTDDISVTVRDANASGEVLATLSLDALDIGEKSQIQYELDDRYMFLNDGNSMHALYFEAASDTDEIQLANNNHRFVFENALPIQVIATDDSSELSISVSIENYTEAMLNNILIAAIYDANGRMLSAKSHSVTSSPGEKNNFEYTFDCSNFSGEINAKVFWMEEGTFNPLSISWNTRGQSPRVFSLRI